MTMSKRRQQRKMEHLTLADHGQGFRCSFLSPFDSIELKHDALTQVDPDSVELAGTIGGLPVDNVLFINAITGGALAAEHVNRHLAAAARRHNLAMAVGSQTAALGNKSLAWTYSVARKYHPEGLLIANVPASIEPQLAKAAVAMIDAQVLQVHLNPAQELLMPEGDRISPRLLDNIAAICRRVSVPVIAKEVGFGLMAEQAEKLRKLGVTGVDVGGRGGTNFALIEGRRNRDDWWRPFARWGWPTPVCIADVAGKVPGIEVLASGGINDGVMAVKALALGATGVGIAGAPLQALRKGPKQLDLLLSKYVKQMRVAMALAGSATIRDIRGKAYSSGNF